MNPLMSRSAFLQRPPKHLLGGEAYTCILCSLSSLDKLLPQDLGDHLSPEPMFHAPGTN